MNSTGCFADSTAGVIVAFGGSNDLYTCGSWGCASSIASINKEEVLRAGGSTGGTADIIRCAQAIAGAREIRASVAGLGTG